MEEDHEVKMSPLCQPVTSDTRTVQADIYEDGAGGWLLEVIDEYHNSTVWDEPFKTDQEALDEAVNTVEKEGIGSLIGQASEAPR